MTEVMDNNCSTLSIQAIEGNKKWNTTTLFYSFAPDEDAARFSDWLSWRGYEGQFNALDNLSSEETQIVAALQRAVDAYSDISLLSILQTPTSSADLIFSGVENLRNPAEPDKSIYGVGTFPGEYLDIHMDPDRLASYLVVSTDVPGNGVVAETGAGSNGLLTAIHELGHCLGLAHPFDTGGETTILPSNSPLDNMKYTVMSYTAPSGAVGVASADEYGWPVTPMALDIAAIQHMYDPSVRFNKSATTYRLLDAATGPLDTNGSDGTVAIGRAYYCIWDNSTRAVDSIVYSGANQVIINLNDATLSGLTPLYDLDWLSTVKASQQYAELSASARTLFSEDTLPGGAFSSILVNGTPQLGGYSIAHGVVIEDARGGSGNDILVGNESDNTLKGGGGEDLLIGAGGDDYLYGGNNVDTLVGGTGLNYYDGGAGNDTFDLSGGGSSYIRFSGATAGVIVDKITNTIHDGQGGIDTVIDPSGGSFSFDLTVFDDTFIGDDRGNYMGTNRGNDTFDGRGGSDTWNGAKAPSGVKVNLSLVENNAEDGFGFIDTVVNVENVNGSAYADEITGNNGNNRLWGNDSGDTLKGLGRNDFLYGGAGEDTLYGGGGRDYLYGGADRDTLYGEAGRDRFVFETEADAQGDWIKDLSVSEGDLVDFTALADGAFEYSTVDLGGGTFRVRVHFIDDATRDFVFKITVFGTVNDISDVVIF